MNASQLIGTAAGRIEPELVFKNAKILDVFGGQLRRGDVAVSGGRVAGIGAYSGPVEVDCTGKTLVPAFIDGHIHLESSVVSPAQFARIVLPRGTCAVVADPHEIANVMGTAGVSYMLAATQDLPLDVFFMVPACVPATPFDESGAVLGPAETAELMRLPRVLGLAEMMDFVGTVRADDGVLQKIAAANEAGKTVDGHAPGLAGNDLCAYAAAGVRSDHECTTAAEAFQKLALGQRVMIRSGTAGRNLPALLPLLDSPGADRCMFVTDDKHPGDLIARGHIDGIVREAIALGAKPWAAYRAASLGAAEYFGLTGRGAIAPGYLADIVVLDDYESVSIHAVYRKGRLVDDELVSQCTARVPAELERAARDTVHLDKLEPERFALGRARVIGLTPGELITTDEGFADAYDVKADVAKVCVVERHHRTGHIGLCWMKGYGIRNGAVATSVSHDAHNIIAAGASDADIAAAVNAVAAMHGGIAAVSGGEVLGALPLPVAGLMSDAGAAEVEGTVADIKNKAWQMGVPGDIDPVMTLSFVSLPVIPHRKLTTFGVVDVDNFRLMDEKPQEVLE